MRLPAELPSRAAPCSRSGLHAVLALIVGIIVKSCWTTCLMQREHNARVQQRRAEFAAEKAAAAAAAKTD